MPVALVQHGSLDGSSATVTVPGAVTPGNLLVMAIATRDLVPAPVGWAIAVPPLHVHQPPAKFYDGYLSIWSRVAGPSEPSSWAIAPPAIVAASCDVSEWSGVVGGLQALNTTGPFHDLHPTVTIGSGQVGIGLLASYDPNTPTDGPITPSAGSSLATFGDAVASAVGVGSGTFLALWLTGGGYTFAGVTTPGFPILDPMAHWGYALAASFGDAGGGGGGGGAGSAAMHFGDGSVLT
jgi:hypothetical protein